MYRISEVKDKANTEQDWKSIFSSSDPFGIPFRDNITTYLIFYPTAGYHLNEAQYFAITEAAKLLGDEGFLVSETEWQTIGFSAASHWWCAFPAYSDYEKLPLVIENAIYSPRSQWGILLSHEDHCIIGGTPQFIGQIKSVYPQWALDIARLRRTWAVHPEASWIDVVLQQVLT